jgi:hypothetical protein
LEWVIGSPFGSGYAREIAVGTMHGIVEVNPHNFYVQVFLRLGIVGLALMVVIYARLLQRSRRLGDSWGQATCFLLLTQLVFFSTYPPSFEQGLLLGLVANLALLHKDYVRTNEDHRMHDKSQSIRGNNKMPGAPPLGSSR